MKSDKVPATMRPLPLVRLNAVIPTTRGPAIDGATTQTNHGNAGRTDKDPGKPDRPKAPGAQRLFHGVIFCCQGGTLCRGLLAEFFHDLLPSPLFLFIQGDAVRKLGKQQSQEVDNDDHGQDHVVHPLIAQIVKQQLVNRGHDRRGSPEKKIDNTGRQAASLGKPVLDRSQGRTVNKTGPGAIQKGPDINQDDIGDMVSNGHTNKEDDRAQQKAAARTDFGMQTAGNKCQTTDAKTRKSHDKTGSPRVNLKKLTPKRRHQTGIPKKERT